MDQNAFIEEISTRITDAEKVRGLFLAGSFGRNAADPFSDVDLIAIAEPKNFSDVTRDWRSLLESIVPIVFWRERGKDRILINSITEGWLRCDLYIQPREAFTGRAQDTVIALLDRDGLFDELPASLPPRQPSVSRVKFLIGEFIRVLGLLSVVVGREVYVTAAAGAGILRDHLINLLLEAVTIPDRGGALHLSRLLPPEDMRILEGLTIPGAIRAEAVQAHIEIAQKFFPRARELATQLDLVWPEEFEASTKQHLKKHFGSECDVEW
ncbi:MAG: nucleotidyltransferase domain-containing protein [Geminicoccaceae bacterium]